MDSPAGQPLLVVGLGDSGRRLARRWQDAGGGPVTGLRRRPQPEAGVTVHSLDLDQDEALPELPVGGVMVWLAPPPRDGSEDSRLRRYLQPLLARVRPQRLLLASTTGVYGPGEPGGWTDETSPLRPDSDRARRRVDAETVARATAADAGIPLVRLRIAAIYGPGRLPEARLRAGEPLAEELARRPGNRIHVTDLVEALYRAALHAPDGAVYDVADGRPVAFGDYLDACADALALPRLPRTQASPPDEASAFLRADRRIAARRLREDLGLVLHYPDFRQGIAAAARNR